MREYDLPALPSYGKGYEFRKMAAEICNEALAKAARYGVANAEVGELSVFADAIKTAIASYVDVTAPVVSTRVATGANTVTVTFGSALEPSTSVPLSSVVFTPARTVTAIVVSGSTMVITATGAIATDSVAYTAPSEQPKLMGKDGNAVASFSGVVA